MSATKISKQIASLIDPNLEERTKTLIKTFSEKALLLDKVATEYKDYLITTSSILQFLVAMF